jgi:hypothetical protein
MTLEAGAKGRNVRFLSGAKTVISPTVRAESPPYIAAIWSPSKFMDLPEKTGSKVECSGKRLIVFYTKMSFKILKFSNRPSVFFPNNLL